jgi:two-component system response regulator MprA
MSPKAISTVPSTPATVGSSQMQWSSHNARLVLVVDDDDDLRAAIGDALELAGYCVALAADGRGALALLDALDRVPDLIVLDLIMPTMTGRELAERLEQRQNFARVPLLVFTAQANSGAASLLRSVVAVVEKPLSLEDLLVAVERILVRAGPHAASR